jgi:hypothetical protein
LFPVRSQRKIIPSTSIKGEAVVVAADADVAADEVN